MNVVRKKIAGREYAYLSDREGGRVVHKYLGPVTSARVAEIISAKTEIAAVPERFRALFWDTSVHRINIRHNARYVIERVLELGDMDAVSWLKRVYPSQKIIDVLILSRTLSEKSRNFWKVWFGMSDA